MSQTNEAVVEIPQEVEAFAREHRVEAYLPVVVDLARQHFACPDLRVELDVDPEIEDLRHICNWTGPVPISVADALEAKDRYHEALRTHVPAPLNTTFRLGLDLA